MESAFRQKLETIGVDVAAGLERFMGNEALFKKFLMRFGDDPNYAVLQEAVAAGDCEKAFVAAHTLKGVCGNLSLIKLEQLISCQTEQLRGGNLAPAAEMMPAIAAAYEEIVCVINEQKQAIG